MNKTEKKLLIFDLDGTLIDSVPDLANAINAMLVDLQHPTVSEQLVRNWVGNGSWKLVERALYHHTNQDTNQDISQNTDQGTAANASIDNASVANSSVDNASIDNAEAIFLQHYQRCSGKQTTLYHGVEQGLQKLKHTGYNLALVTNKPIQFVPELLLKFGWSADDFFSMVLGGDSLEEKKPHPLPLQHVCAQLKFQAKDCFMIGDSKNDILAGKNAGIDTIGLSYGYNYGQSIDTFNPTHSFAEFPTMVEFLLSIR